MSIETIPRQEVEELRVSYEVNSSQRAKLSDASLVALCLAEDESLREYFTAASDITEIVMDRTGLDHERVTEANRYLFRQNPEKKPYIEVEENEAGQSRIILNPDGRSYLDSEVNLVGGVIVDTE